MGSPIIDDFSASRKSLGESPVSRLKYLPKNEGEAKLRSSLISEIRFWVELSCAFASMMTQRSIQSVALRPVASMMTRERYLALLQSLLA